MFSGNLRILVERQRITIATLAVAGLYKRGGQHHITIDIFCRNCHLAVLYKRSGNNLLAVLLDTMQHLITIEIMTVKHLYIIESITLGRNNLYSKRFAECYCCRQSRTVGSKQSTILGNNLKLAIFTMYIQHHITYCTTVLYDAVTILGTAGGVY